MSAGKRNGVLQPEDFEDEAFLSKLDPIVEQLHKDVPDAKYDRKSLAQLILQLRQFMENVMGKEGIAKTYPKLPASLFRDFRPDGAIAVIASRLHQFKKTRGIRQVDWGNPSMRRQVLEIVNHCRRELEKLRLLKQPVIHLHSSLKAQDSERLKEVATKMGAQLSASESDPNVTHIVYPFGPKGDPDDGKEYMRVLEFKGDKALVHWWYLPDSYDELIPKGPNMRLDPEKTPPGPWKVYPRWLTDSEKFNEWMNPADYETEESIEATEKKSGAAQPATSKPEAKPEQPPPEPKSAPKAAPTTGPPRPPLPARPAAPAPTPDGAPSASQPGGAASQPSGPPQPALPKAPGAPAGEGAAANAATPSKTGPSPMAPIQGQQERQAPSAPVPTAAAAAKGAWAGVRARGSISDSGPPAKKMKLEHEVMEVAPGSAARVLPYGLQYRSVEVHRSVTEGSLAVEGMSHGQRRYGDVLPYGHPPRIPPPPQTTTDNSTSATTSTAAAAAHTPPATAATAAANGAAGSAAAQEPQAAQWGSEQQVARSTLLVPLHTAWFRWHTISRAEEQEMPEFFTGRFPSKTPQNYRLYRNTFIDAYRTNPSKPLTHSAAQSLVEGDAATTSKVWSFLDRWGLINYQARPPHGAAATAAAADAIARGASQGEVSYLLALRQPTQAEAIAALTTGGRSLPLQRQQNRAKAAQPQVSVIDPPQIRCSAMPWVDCTTLRYHCVKHPDVNLCPEAFAKGLFPVGCSSKDFVKIDHRNQASVADDSNWTPSETLLLLEGIELFGEEWAAVAEHVGDKMPSQCVQRFLSLPIDDTLLDELEQGASAPNSLQAPPGTISPACTVSHAPPPGIRVPVPAISPSVVSLMRRRESMRPPQSATAATATQQAASAQQAASQNGSTSEQQPPQQQQRQQQQGSEQHQGSEQSKADQPQQEQDQNKADQNKAEQPQQHEALPPLEDDPLAKLAASADAWDEAACTAIDAYVLNQVQVPFSEHPNPLMALVALCSMTLGPTITGDAAEAGLVALSNEIKAAEDGDLQQVALSQEAVKRAAAAALVTGAMRARQMADEEETEMHEQVLHMVKLRLSQADHKLRVLEELEKDLEKECSSSHTQRTQIVSKLEKLRGGPQPMATD